MSDPIFVDLSHWNPTPNWTSLQQGGVKGVILKATEGTGYVDPTFRSRYDGAIAAGLPVATYHFLKAGNIQTQMNLWLNTVQPRDGERMCIDHEEKASLAELEQAVEYLLSDSRGLQITIYSGHLIKEQLGSVRSEILAANTSLWIAQYGSTVSWPTNTWPDWTLWQYTDKASVSGIAAAVDGNRFNGSDENAVLWLAPAGAMPQPEPKPPNIEVQMLLDLKVADGVTYAVYVNGKLVDERVPDVA